MSSRQGTSSSCSCSAWLLLLLSASAPPPSSGRRYRNLAADSIITHRMPFWIILAVREISVLRLEEEEEEEPNVGLVP